MMADRKMTATRLANLMNVNRVTVSNWKNSDSMPSMDGSRLNELCCHLRCNPSELIEFSPNWDVAS